MAARKHILSSNATASRCISIGQGAPVMLVVLDLCSVMLQSIMSIIVKKAMPQQNQFVITCSFMKNFRGNSSNQ